MSENSAETKDFVDAFVGALDQEGLGESALAPKMPLLFGRYILVRHLASGGMGDVYLALVRGPGSFRRLVAIKTLRAHLVKEKRFVEMFFDEARIAACLIQPNIVQTFDFGIHRGVYFLAMEHVHGLSLSQVIQESPVPLDVSFSLAMGAATGLAYAHDAKDQEGRPMAMVHRDIAPKNILVSFTGDLKLTDFGIASAADNAHLTQTGEVKGTVNYMPIEQLEGKRADPRWDIYALGITFYELFTRTRPLDLARAGLADLLDPEKRTFAPASVVNPLLPTTLSNIIGKCTAPDPRERYDNGRELLADLRNLAKEIGLDHHPDIVAAWLQKYFSSHAESPILSKAEWVLAEACDETGFSTPTAGPDDDTGTLSPRDFDARRSSKRTGPTAASGLAMSEAPTESNPAGIPPSSKSQAFRPGTSALPSADDSIVSLRSGRRILLVFALVALGAATTYVATRLTNTGSAPTPDSDTTTSIDWGVHLGSGSPATMPSLAKNADAAVAVPPDGPSSPSSTAAQSTIAITLTSTPSVAAVYENGKLLGHTPLKIQRQRDAAKNLPLRLTKKGYRSARRRVGLATDSDIRVVLKARAKTYRSSDLHHE